jgi:DNA-binding IclR family transcriptional regulator
VKRIRKTRPIGVLTKALRIMDLVRASSSPLTLHEVSNVTGINKSTALRVLAHLEMDQYLARDMRGGYSAGTKILQTWAQASAHTRLRDAARRPLWELWQATKESANLGVLDGHEVLYLDCLESPQDFRLVAHIGTRAAFYRTSLGKAMAAFLPPQARGLLLASTHFETFTPGTLDSGARLEEELAKIRQTGYSVDNEESMVGVRCVAAPVLDASGQPVAAVSVAGPASRITPETVLTLGAAVQATARDIAAGLLA